VTEQRAWLLVGGVVLSASVAITAIRIARTTPEAYELGYGEGLILWMAERVADPAALYHPIDRYPFIVGVYPPLFPLAVSTAQWLVGDVRLAGRLVSLFAFVGTLVAMGALSRAAVPSRFGEKARWSAALIAVGLGASASTLQTFPPAARVDGLALCLSLTGLWLFLTARPRSARQYLSCVIFGAAVFTKQSFVSALVAALAITALTELALAIRLAVLVGAILVVPALWLQQKTAGQFLVHVFVYPRNEFQTSRLLKLLVPNLREMLPQLTLTAVTFLYTFRGESAASTTDGTPAQDERRSIACLILYLVLSFLVSLTAGKIGSAEYYFMEWNAAACVLTGVAIGLVVGRSQLKDAASERDLLSLAWVAVVLTAGLSVASGVNNAMPLTSGARELLVARRGETHEAAQLIRSTSAPVMSEDLSLLVTTGRDVPFEPFIMWELCRQGRWNPTPFLNQLNERFYGALVFEHDLAIADRIPDTIRRAMLSNYRHVKNIGRYWVYAPK
jgi:hypothetical protein